MSPLTNESIQGGGASAPSPATLGRQAALDKQPRTSPYDGRSRDHKLWLEGYDSVKEAPPTSEPEEKPVSRRHSNEIFVARESGSTQIPGGDTVVYVKGVTRVRGGHPLLDIVPQYFEPMDRGVHYDVEDMTANPGEKRGEAR